METDNTDSRKKGGLHRRERTTEYTEYTDRRKPGRQRADEDRRKKENR